MTEIDDNRLVLGESRTLGYMDGLHRGSAVDWITEHHSEDDGPHAWTQRRTKITTVVRKEGKFLFDREIIILSNQYNEAANKTKKELTFLELLKKVFKVSEALEAEYGVPFIEVRIKDIVDDMFTSRFISGEQV